MLREQAVALTGESSLLRSAMIKGGGLEFYNSYPGYTKSQVVNTDGFSPT